MSGWTSYVALGDSFTEGLDDPLGDGTYRGWADLVATALARRTPGFRYANLAVRGRLFDGVVDDQVPHALRMGPALASFAAGGNDALRRRFDAGVMVRRFDEAVRSLRAGGTDVVLFKFADVTARLPGRRVLLPRVELLNRAVDEVADRHDAVVVDLWSDRSFHDPRLWSEDRLHLGPAGHRRVAAHVLSRLGVPHEPEWFAPLPPSARTRWLAARRADARWVRAHLAPWVRRRLEGRSSGDAVAPKRPELTLLD